MLSLGLSRVDDVSLSLVLPVAYLRRNSQEETEGEREGEGEQGGEGEEEEAGEGGGGGEGKEGEGEGEGGKTVGSAWMERQLWTAVLCFMSIPLG